MKDRLLLVDGHNLLFQMFYGMPSRITGRSGVDIRGVVGFVGALCRLIRMCAPTHIALIFDSETHNPRYDILDEYKANRPDFSLMSDDENPFARLPDIYRAIDKMGIRHEEARLAECDDVIASYALSYKDECEIVISSHDSDFLQLISDSVRILRYRGDSTLICDREYVMNKFGVSPGLYIDAKALYGDTSDNIPGIRGIGPKTAAKLVSEAGGAEELIRSPERIQNPRLRKMIEESGDMIRRNLSLMRLSGDAPLPFTLDELKWEPRVYRTMDILKNIDLI